MLRKHKNTLVIIISNSGETKRLAELCTQAEKNNRDILSFTGDKNSTIAKHSTLAISSDTFGPMDDPAHKDNLHILTSALGVRRLSSNNFLRPDSSPFYCFSRNGSNGSRLACLGNRRSYSKIKPPIFQIYPWILGIKKERLSIPDTGANRRSMYMVIFNFISYNGLALGTSAFWISKVFSTFFRLISWKRIFISKNGPFSAND